MMRHLPSAEDAERFVLGSIIFHGPQLHQVTDVLKGPKDFFDGKHEALYAAMLELDREGKPITLITMAEKLRQSGTMCKLTAFGNEAYVAELANLGLPSENLGALAQMIREKASVREMILTTSDISDEGYKPEIDVADYLDRAQQRVFNAACHSLQVPYHSVHQTLPAVYRRLRDQQEAGGGLRGTSTGYTYLDRLLSGLQERLVYIVAGRPAMGKTAFALCIADHLGVEEDEPVLIFSLEMGKEELVERLIAARARVSSQAMRAGLLDPDAWMRVIQAGEVLDKAPIFIDDPGR
jgi:replicative DNA helicase